MACARQDELRFAERRAAERADPAVRPCLPGNPLDGIHAVGGVVPIRSEHAFGFVAPAHVLDGHGKAAAHEGKADALGCADAGAPVRRAHQYRRQRCRRSRWDVQGGCEPDPVAHRNHRALDAKADQCADHRFQNVVGEHAANVLPANPRKKGQGRKERDNKPDNQ